MKHSIRTRLVLMVAVLIGAILTLCWFMNKTLLPEYYETYKIAMLGQAYDNVSKICEDELINENEASGQEQGTDEEVGSALDDEITKTLESLGANNSMNLYLFQLYQDSVFGIFPLYIYPTMENMNKARESQVTEKIFSYLQGDAISRREVLKRTSGYGIYKVFDERVNSYYLELFGTLDGKNTGVYIRSNYQSMMESISISNRFLAYVGIGVTLLGIILMYFISRSFTRPVLELEEIAKKMSALEFDKKYTGKRMDEIGHLGNSINILSEKLEETISELKSANNELLKDIENKQQIDDMRTEFLSNVSHELKTPIALIQGYAEGLAENISDDPESRDFYCEVIMDEAGKMNKMVKKLLSLNHIEFGKNPVTFEHFDIVTVVASVLSSAEILFQQKGITLHFEEKMPIYVWADEYMIEEVITNYISNALNHVNDSGVIEVKLMERENNTVRIAVYNTGEPIPEEAIGQIWDKFYKVDKARTREYGGSGIGLSIVKAIMESHNQGYGVMNRENGVEFWFELDMKND